MSAAPTSRNSQPASRRGLLVVLAGPSGVGKTTIRQRLLEKHAPRWVKSVSATTRPPRAGEVDGVNYFFLSAEQFAAWVADGRFIEHAEYQGRRYGTPEAFVQGEVDQGRVVLLDIDVQGVQQLEDDGRLPLLTIFVCPPSREVLAERLAARGTEDPAKVAGRLARAQQELALAPLFEFTVINDDLERAVAEVEGLVLARLRQTEGNDGRQS